jgi:signal transduction histidine kinase
MLKCVVVDDDPISRTNLKVLCQRHAQVELLEEFESAEAAKSYLSGNKETIDLLFLDMEMPGMSGLELLEQLKLTAQVIFVTAHTDYAVDAFEHKATDFLKKPCTLPRFEQAIQKALEVYAARNRSDTNMDAVFDSIQSLAHEKRNMLRLLAHDLRNPLFALQLKAANLKASDPESQTARDIESAVLRIGHLTNSILQFEDEALDKVQNLMQIFELNPIIIQVKKHLDILAKEKNIQLSLAGLEKPVAIAGEPNLTEHLLENLLSNALKYAPEHSTVAVQITETLDFYIARIIDHGPGIPPEKMEQIFTYNKPKIAALNSGIGIGLSLCKKFAELMDMDLSIEKSDHTGTVMQLKMRKNAKK